MSDTKKDEITPEAIEQKKEKERPKYKLYLNLFDDKEKGTIKTLKMLISDNIQTILDMKGEIRKLFEQLIKASNTKFTLEYISTSENSKPLSDEIKIRMYFEEKADVFIKVKAEAIPVSVKPATENKNKDIVLNYKTLTTYSFYVASETVVRVIVPVPGIENVPKENIISKFTEDSLEVKINNALNGNNYRFAVPKLDAKIIPENSEAYAKGKDLMIRLKKANKDDHWSYLFKQKYVGE